MPEEQLNPEHAAVEAALASLIPVDPNWDRDQLIYAAGIQAANRLAKRTQRMWFAATAALVLISTGLSCLLLMQPEPAVVERIVYRDRETKEPQTDNYATPSSSADDRKRRFQPESAPSQYIRLRQLVLTQGVDRLPETQPKLNSYTAPGSTDSGGRKLLDELLGA